MQEALKVGFCLPKEFLNSCPYLLRALLFSFDGRESSRML